MNKGKIIKEIEKRRYGLLAALLAAVLPFFIFLLAHRLFGDYTFTIGDLGAQYVYFIKLFLRSLFGEGALDYTFEVGMGLPSIPLYAYYCLSPFNFIYLLIKNIEIASAVVVLLKFSVAAYAFQRFTVRILNQDTPASAVFALCYALCGYSISFYFNIINSDGIYMLPVIVTLVVEYVRTGAYKKLILAYAYQFVVMFYSGFINGIFSFLILFLVMVYEYGREWKKYLRGLLKFAGIVVLAALMGAAVLFPTAFCLLRNSIDAASDFEILDLNILDVYNNLFIGEMQSIKVTIPIIYSGLVVLFLVPLYFLHRQVGKKEKILFAFLLVFLLACTFWQPLYILMHGFNSPNYFGFRFSYFYSFLLLTIACRAWELLGETKAWKYYLIVICNIVVYYLVWQMQKKSLSEEEQSSSMLGLEINALFLILYAIVFLWRKKSQDKKIFCQWILLVTVSLELFINGYFCNTRLGYHIIDDRLVVDMTDQVTRAALDEIERDRTAAGKEAGFRLKYMDVSTYNLSALYGYRGLGYFSTVENRALREALFRLGYCTNTNLCIDYGGTPVTRMLFSQDYLVHFYRYEQGENDFIEKNDECLSLGFMVSDQVKEFYWRDDAFMNQNTLLQAMTGGEENCFLPYENNIYLSSENMVMIWDEEKGQYIIWIDDSEQKEGRIRFALEADREQPLYAYFSEDTSIKNDASPKLLSEGEKIESLLVQPNLSCPRIFPLGRNQEGRYEAVIYIGDGMLESYYFNNYYFYYYNEESLKRVYHELAQHQMTITDIQGDTIEASISVNEDRTVLFTSIPYDDGWKVTVDGERIETFSVLEGAFLALELTPGDHTLIFTYNSMNDRIGKYISVMALLVYLGLAVKDGWQKGWFK